jgi:nitrile hydratase subunit beta
MSYVNHADLGGREGFGRVVAETDEVLWHAPWEARALAVSLAMGATGAWNIDMSRSARETLPDYAQLSYYRIWLAALCKLMIERGLVTEAELTAARADPERKPLPLPRMLRASEVTAALGKGSPATRPAVGGARFSIGDRVRTRAGHVDHHTRLPGYAAGRVGTIERLHGTHVFADAHARGLGEQPQWLYAVTFDGRDLWAEAAEPGSTISIDAWDEYLEPA